jgi:hypothetical protein
MELKPKDQHNHFGDDVLNGTDDAMTDETFQKEVEHFRAKGYTLKPAHREVDISESIANASEKISFLGLTPRWLEREGMFAAYATEPSRMIHQFKHAVKWGEKYGQANAVMCNAAMTYTFLHPDRRYFSFWKQKFEEARSWPGVKARMITPNEILNFWTGKESSNYETDAM